jgi:4-hydroxybenzoate polyprenyltransferase
MNSKLKHWLVLTRCSNLPTVWSNVLSGWLLGLATIINAPTVEQPSALSYNLFILLAGISLLYVGGMILNDVFDYEWDVVNRPERPLPSGFISRNHARWTGYFVLLAGAILSIYSTGKYFNPTICALVSLLIVFILWYDASHKGNSFAPVVMGGCRALLPIIGFTVATSSGAYDLPRILCVYAIVLGIYTYALTWVAKYEVTPNKNSFWIEQVLFLIPLPLVVYGHLTYWGLAAVILYYVWILVSNYRHPVPAGISARVADRIAAISLLDSIISGVVLLMIVRWYGSCCMPTDHDSIKGVVLLAMFAPPICFGITLWLRKFIPST